MVSKMRKKFTVSNLIVQILLVIWAIIQLYPMLFMVFSSFKETGEIMMSPFALPSSLYVQNYIDAWRGNAATAEYSMRVFFGNSVLITVISMVVLVFVTLFAGYALARFKFPGYKFVYYMVTCFIAIPTQALIVPVFVMIQEWGGLNNPLSMIPLLVTFNLAFSIVIMKTNFESIPHEIEEAACIDGCSKFKTFWYVSMPMSRGSIATIVIVNLTALWSEFMYSSVILMLPESRTLPVAISMFNTNMYNNTLGPLMASLTIASIPLVLAYFVFQKQIVKGMAVGAIK